MLRLTLIICLGFSIKAYSWGSRGHKIVAQIAKKCLDKSIVDSVNYYLGDMSWEDAAVWMDEIRSDHSYDNLKPMHYVNIEKDKTYVKNPEGDVVSELEIMINGLKSKYLKQKNRKESMAFALRLIFHLVGDIHQPLHCGYAEDKGGNTIDVDFLGKESNLHKVWDTEIIENKKLNTGMCLEFINGMSVADKASVQKINVEEWVKESRTYLPGVYGFEKHIIDQSYIDKNEPVIIKQLSKAGIRLAVLLNSAFK